jgi:hypothetical protein
MALANKKTPSACALGFGQAGAGSIMGQISRIIASAFRDFESDYPLTQTIISKIITFSALSSYFQKNLNKLKSRGNSGGNNPKAGLT